LGLSAASSVAECCAWTRFLSIPDKLLALADEAIE
jgi:hypothetical protein